MVKIRKTKVKIYKWPTNSIPFYNNGLHSRLTTSIVTWLSKVSSHFCEFSLPWCGLPLPNSVSFLESQSPRLGYQEIIIIFLSLKNIYPATTLSNEILGKSRLITSPLYIIHPFPLWSSFDCNLFYYVFVGIQFHAYTQALDIKNSSLQQPNQYKNWFRQHI